MFSTLRRRRFQDASHVSGSQLGAAIAKRMYCLRSNSGEPVSYTIVTPSTQQERYVRLTDETAIGSTARLPQPGRCVDFNGTSSKIVFDETGLLASANDYSIVCRFRCDTTSSGMTIFSNIDGSGDGIELHIDASNFLVVESNSSTVTTSQAITTGRWYTVALSQTSSNSLTVFVCDHTTGLLINVAEATLASSQSSGTALTVGSDGAGNWFDGKVALLAVYGDAARSNAELQAICESNLPEGHDILAWFEDGAGTKHWDSSGTGWHGTGTNITHLSDGTNSVYSRQNEYGYTAGTGSNGAAVGEFIPRQESTAFYIDGPRDKRDANDNLVGNKGKVSYGPVVLSPYLTLDGVGDRVVGGNVGVDATTITMTIRLPVDNQVICTLDGATTAAIRVSSGVLQFGGVSQAATVDGVSLIAAAAGAALNDNEWHHVSVTINATLSTGVILGQDGTTYGQVDVARFALDGTFVVDYPCCEASGLSVYDVGQLGRHMELETSDEAAAWAGRGAASEHLSSYGARLVGGAYIPGTSAGVAATGDVLTHPPRHLLPCQSLDLAGGEPNSPYARQLAAYVSTSYAQGDGPGAGIGEGALYATVTGVGDNTIFTVLPPASGVSDELLRAIE